MTDGSESGLGVLSEAVRDSGMALAEDETAGLNVAGAVVGELNSLLEAAESPRTEEALVDARACLESADGSSLVDAFETAESCLTTATEAARNSDVEHDVRELRQALLGLIDDEEPEANQGGV